MFKKIKSAIMALAVMPTLLFAPLALTGAASAVCTGANSTAITSNLDKGVTSAAGNASSDAGCDTNANNTIGDIASKVVNILSIVIGAIAVIMIIFAGFRYITSGGDSGGVSSAKNTLIYAIIGLVIVVLAQVIVHFVINTASTAA